MINAKIVGAGGYGGVGLVELLLNHPEVHIQTLIAKDQVGMRMSDLYPHLEGLCDQVILGVDEAGASEPADVVFFSTPDGVGMRAAGAELAQGAKVIDYSGDFRFNSEETYADYAGRLGKPTQHASPDLLIQSVYGLAELGLDDLTQHALIGNPGCFAASCLLGLAAAVKHQLIEPGSIIADCKTGVSGAGKKPAPTFHYPARYDHMNAYRLSGHQHVCEVEHQLGRLAGEDVVMTFTAQVVPATRGILSTLYGQLRSGVTAQQVQEAYAAFHQGQAFVKLFDGSAQVGTAHVRGSNRCYLMVDVDERTQRLRVVSHIDNLMKGQASNAVQNMNLAFALPETTGLERPGQYP